MGPSTWDRPQVGRSTVPLFHEPAIDYPHAPSCELDPKAARDLGQGELRVSFDRRLLRGRPASPLLDGLQSSRAVLLTDRLDRLAIQVMAYRILAGAGHEVPCAARVSPKHPR